MSTYRDSYRERDREWDETSYRSDRPKTYTTVHRYKVPDRGSDRTRSNYDDEEVDVHVTRHGGDRYDYDSSDRRSSRDVRYSSRDDRDDYHREWRVERDVSRDQPRTRVLERDRDDGLERYTRTTEYLSSPDRQPIIIRNEAAQPIIIREREREPMREVVIREKESEKVEDRDDSRSHISEVKDKESIRESVHDDRTTTVSRREDPPPVQTPEEDYYFERRTRQIARRSSEDDERRPSRRDRRDSFSSDDEYYYKKTETFEDGRDHSPHHGRHIAEGAILGAGASALMNHHRKQKGEKSGGIGQTIGGAALGAVGAEVVTRAKDYYERSRSRPARERSRERRHHSDDDSDSRSRSRSRGGNYRKLGAIAAMGALAGYALSRRNKDKPEERRSRSRRRRGSVDRDRSLSGGSDREVGSRSRSKSKATIAGAGLASAAVVGLVERARSKSKGRSRSRIRSALPAAAAGVGGAALAGLYERKKNKKAEEERSRSRSRSRGPAHRVREAGQGEGSRDMANSDRGLIDDGRPGRRGSDASSSSSTRRPHHGHRDEDAAGGAGVAGVAAHEASQRRERKRAERERRRHNEGSGQQQQPEQYNFGPYAQAAPQPIMNEVPPQPPFIPAQHQQAQQYYPQNANYQPSNVYAPVPNFANHPQPAPQQHFDYGSNNGYPGPTNDHINHDHHAGYPQFPQQSRDLDSPSPYGSGTHDKYRPQGNNVSDGPSHGIDNIENRETVKSTSSSPGPTASSVHTRGKSVQFDLDPDEHEPERAASDDGIVEERHARERARRDLEGDDNDDDNDNNKDDTNGETETSHRRRRRRKNKDVDRHSRPDDEEGPRDWNDRSERNERNEHAERNEKDKDSNSNKHRRKKRRHSISGSEPSSRSSGRKGRHRRTARSPGSDDSDETIELPDRFDKEGRRKPDRGEDPLADKIEDFLSGKGKAGRLFQKLAGDLGGGGSSSR